MAETVLVTGGTGFVAGWCIAELLDGGYQVRATVRSLSKEPDVRGAVAPPRVQHGSTDVRRGGSDRTTRLGRPQCRAATTCCTLRRRSAVAPGRSRTR